MKLIKASKIVKDNIGSTSLSQAEPQKFNFGGGRLFEFGFACASIAALLILVPMVFVNVGFFFGIALVPAVFIVGIIAGLVSAFLLVRNSKSFAIALISILLVCGAFTFLLSTTTDLSFDSLSYHTRAIDDLAHGYNPVKETHKVPWINYYPKGIWIFQAGIFQLTGDMESTSIINMLGLFIALGCALMFVSRAKSLQKPIAAVLVICSTLAPIGVVQLTTHFVDGIFGSFAIGSIWIIVGLIMGVFKRKNLRLEILLGSILMLLPLAKFTGFVFGCSLLAIYLGYLLIFHRDATELKRYALFFLILLISLFTISFDPYVQNAIQYKNPFYPILSEDIHNFKDAPDERQRPRAYKLVNPVSGLVMSLTEQTKSVGDSHGYRPKFPLSISSSEIEALGEPDTAIGGNGPLFFLSILIGACGYAFYLFQKDVSKRNKLISALLVGGILVSSLVMLETWWTRLVPFLSMVPVLLLLIISSKKENRVLQAFSALLAIVMVTNTGIIVYATVRKVGENQATTRSLERYFATNSPTYFRFDPDAHENVLVSLRRVIKDFGSTATELPNNDPSDQLIFIDDSTGDKQTRFIYADDPPADQEDIKNTWEHIVPLQALFTFIEK